METHESDKELERSPGESALDRIPVRDLRPEDLDRMVQIDRAITGTDRRGYYKQRLATALQESGVRVSLAAEIDGTLAGFVLGRLYYGEYGHTDTFATIDTIGVDPGFRGRGVGHALLQQLTRNLRALHVECIQTEVDWQQWDLMRFLQEVGFRPVPRLSLELALS